MEKEIYTFKPVFTREEQRELMEWFEQRMDKLPKELQINKSTHSADLPRTVKAMIGVIKEKGGSTAFSGYIAHLELIRERLKRQGME